MHKYYLENIQNYPAILYQETQPDGFTDISNNAVLIDKYGTRVRDYLFVRDDINNILFPKANPNYLSSPSVIDFSGFFTVLTAEERKIMAKHILAPYALRLTQFSDADDKENWFELLRITQGTEHEKTPFTGRALLIEMMRRHVANKVRIEELTMPQTQEFFEDVFELTEWYIRSANPKFKLWLTSTGIYQNNGFNSKSYWSQALEGELIEIYETGITE